MQHMADQGFTEFSRVAILKEMLPDLHACISPYTPGNPTELTMNVNLISGAVEPRESVIVKTGDPAIDVQGMAKVQRGRIRFTIVLRSIGQNVIETPVKMSWEVLLESERASQEVGKVSRFLKVPLQHLDSESQDFLEIRVADLRRGIVNQDCVKCIWKVNLEWLHEDVIVDFNQKSILALHHIADIMDTFEGNFKSQQRQQDEMRQWLEELGVEQR